MNKSLMISIQPQHAVNILNGKKTLELRTWTPKGYVGWVYVYVTKGKRLSVVHDDENGKTYYYLNSNWGRSLNQDIPFKFWFDEYEDIDYQQTVLHKYGYGTLDYQVNIRVMDTVKYILNDDILDKLCLTNDEVEKYGKGKDLYAWHIKKLEIFDEPKKLSDFYVLYGGEESFYPLKKAPQRSVWVYGN